MRNKKPHVVSVGSNLNFSDVYAWEIPVDMKHFWMID